MRIREPYDIRDERFRSICLANVDLHQLDASNHWAEGPVWFGDADCLLWSDIPQNRIMRWTPNGGVGPARTSRTAIRGTGRVGSSPANIRPAASLAPNATGASRFSPIPSKAVA